MVIAHLAPLLTTHIHEKANLAPSAVTITFDRPNRETINAPTEPTINLFAMATQEETTMRVRGHETHALPNNRKQTRELPSYVNIHYAAYVLSGSFADECELHWRLRAALMHHGLLAQRLREGLVLQAGQLVKTCLDEQDIWRKTLDFWNALGLPPRPTLFFTVTVPMDLDITSEFGVVTQVTLQAASGTGYLRNIAGTVFIQHGTERKPVAQAKVNWHARPEAPCYTDALGQFKLSNIRPGAITLDVASPDGATASADFDADATRFDIDLK